MDSPSFKHASFKLALIAAFAWCAPALAAPPSTVLGEDWVAIDPALLEDMRGGFITDGGTALSFGIERAVFVNGEMIPDRSDLTRPLAAGDRVHVIQALTGG